MSNSNNIDQIKRELNHLSLKRKEIYRAICAVNNIFNGDKDACARCGYVKGHVDHEADKMGNEEHFHHYVPSIYVGNLQENELVYSIENVGANLYITNRGLRFDANENDDDDDIDSLPSEWYTEVRLNVLNNLDKIIEGVLNALRLQSERLKIYDEGIEKANKILQALKGSD